MIDVDKSIFDENLRSYCEMNHCGHYNKNYACPPSVGGAKELIGEAKGYKKALVFQTVNSIADSYDFEGMQEVGKLDEFKKENSEIKKENLKAQVKAKVED